MSSSDGVLVTGLGVLSCVGSGVDAFWRGMGAASSAPSRAADPHAHMDHPLMYSVPAADVPAQPRHQAGLWTGTASRFAIEAARQALADAGDADGTAAGLTTADSRLGVVVGTGMGDAGLQESWRVDGGPPQSAWSPAFPVASVLGDRVGATGPVISVSNACAAGGYALSVAADLIRSGAADVVLAGGAEAYSRVALACFNRLGAIDPERCRPFDRNRAGTVFGEGAAILVLESAAHAAARGASTVYAELAGAGWTCDAHHATAPEPTGTQIVRAMRLALAEAGSGPDDVGCVVPHGTGTELNDAVESRALGEVLGERVAKTPLYSLKGLVGHTGGAAGALAAAAAVLIAHRRTVPPNVPVADQDPECTVDLPDAEVPLAGNGVLVNAYAFGGNNVSLLMRGAA